mgnify:CR=1 FL=1
MLNAVLQNDLKRIYKKIKKFSSTTYFGVTINKAIASNLSWVGFRNTAYRYEMIGKAGKFAPCAGYIS